VSTMFFVYAVIMLVSVIILLVNFNPYKEAVKCYTVIESDAFFMICLSVLYISCLGLNVVDVQVRKYKISLIAISLLVTTVLVIYISAITLHWIYSRRKWGKQLLLSIKFRILANRILHDIVWTDIIVGMCALIDYWTKLLMWTALISIRSAYRKNDIV
jgi:hypothetical protein